MHKTDSAADYHHGFLTCTDADSRSQWAAKWRQASPSLGPEAQRQARKDIQLREQGVNPDAAREWISWTDAEGIPTFD